MDSSVLVLIGAAVVGIVVLKIIIKSLKIFFGFAIIMAVGITIFMVEPLRVWIYGLF